MFLVKRQLPRMILYVFIWGNPRLQGYKGEQDEGVTLDYDMEAVHTWAEGEPDPDACLGQAPDNPKHYKVFKYRKQLADAGYHLIPHPFHVDASWSKYVKFSKDWDQLSDELYFQYLDDLDEAARRRRNGKSQDEPTGTSRDEVAAWVVERHVIADSSIREIWYLPHGAPSDEIRLLEVNDRLAGNEDKAEAIDFGLDVEGAKFHLLVADITTDQLEQIRNDPSRLPPGWSLSDGKIRRRGA